MLHHIEYGLSRDESQWDLIETRRKYARTLEEKYYDEYEELIDNAKHAVSLLPVSHSDVFFVEKAANGNEVYDISYTSHGKKIKVSCKTKELEDKGYLFNTNDYIFKNVDIMNRKIFSDKKTTIHDSLLKMYKNEEDYFNSITDLLLEKENIDLWIKLSNDRFIGHGDYYKTIDNGNVRYYPENLDDDHIEISRLHKVNKNTIQYYAFLKNDVSIKQKYHITFKIRFIKNKKTLVSFDKNNSPKILGASVVLSLENPIEKYV